jgi:lipoate-protein ligase B
MNGQFHGLCPIAQAMSWQHQAYHLVKSETAAQILGFELSPVITLGLRGDAERDIVAAKNQNTPFEIFKVDRGGEATMHMPGQLVIFPVVPLRTLNLSVREFVHSLIAITQATLREFNVQTSCHPDEPGLYTERGKIAFFGIRIRHGISTHGLAINIHNELRHFQRIRSCGVTDAKVDSLLQYGIKVPLDEVFQIWLKHAESSWHKP